MFVEKTAGFEERGDSVVDGTDLMIEAAGVQKVYEAGGLRVRALRGVALGMGRGGAARGGVRAEGLRGRRSAGKGAPGRGPRHSPRGDGGHHGALGLREDDAPER